MDREADSEPILCRPGGVPRRVRRRLRAQGPHRVHLGGSRHRSRTVRISGSRGPHANRPVAGRRRHGPRPQRTRPHPLADLRVNPTPEPCTPPGVLAGQAEGRRLRADRRSDRACVPGTRTHPRRRGDEARRARGGPWRRRSPTGSVGEEAGTSLGAPGRKHPTRIDPSSHALRKSASSPFQDRRGASEWRVRRSRHSIGRPIRSDPPPAPRHAPGEEAGVRERMGRCRDRPPGPAPRTARHRSGERPPRTLRPPGCARVALRSSYASIAKETADGGHGGDHEASGGRCAEGSPAAGRDRSTPAT